MANNNGNDPIASGSADLQRYQERIRELEAQLQEKDDACFELSATVATIQAESKYTVSSIHQQSQLEIKRKDEELRRLTHEANQAHMALARLKQQEKQAVGPPQAQKHLRVDGHDRLPSTILIQTQQPSQPAAPASASSNGSSGQTLAQHLLLKTWAQGQAMQDRDITSFLQQAQYSHSIQETDTVWYILQRSMLLHDHSNVNSANQWLNEALIWSPISRRILRKACCDPPQVQENTVPSRIQPTINLQVVVDSLLNPLWTPSANPNPISQNRTNIFHASRCLEWRNRVSSNPEHWFLVATLLHDCPSKGFATPWFTVMSRHVVPCWEAFCLSRLPTPRRVQTSTVQSSVMTEQAFLQSLHLFATVFSQNKFEIDRTVMNIMLDLLEFEFPNRNFDVVLGIFNFLSANFDLQLLRAQSTTAQDERALSALGVSIVIVTKAQLQLGEFMDQHDHDAAAAFLEPEYRQWERIRNAAVRLFHQVLRHVQADQSNNKPCFSSLLKERQHDYLGVCSHILAANHENNTLQGLVKLQLEEIQSDREEIQSMRLRQSSK